MIKHKLYCQISQIRFGHFFHKFFSESLWVIYSFQQLIDQSIYQVNNLFGVPTDNSRAIDALIKNGADIEYDLYGSTPLFLALFNGSHLQSYLFFFFANENIETNWLNHQNSILGNKELVERLVKAGANVTRHLLHTKLTVLHMAAFQGFLREMEYFRILKKKKWIKLLVFINRWHNYGWKVDQSWCPIERTGYGRKHTNLFGFATRYLSIFNI